MIIAVVALLAQAIPTDPSLPLQNPIQIKEVRTVLEVYDDDKECGVVTVELKLGDIIRRWEYGAGVKWDKGFFTRFVHEVDFNTAGFIPRVVVELKDRPGEVNIKAGIKASVFLFPEDKNSPPLQFSGQRVLDTSVGEGRLELEPMQGVDKPGLNPEFAIVSTAATVSGVKLDRALSPAITSESTAARNRFYSKLWPNGSKLKIAFQGGTQEMRREFASTASEWTSIGKANLILDFGAGGSEVVEGAFYEWGDGNKTDCDIRVGFEEGSSWSYIGVDSKNQSFSPSNKSSINIPASLFKIKISTELEPMMAFSRPTILHEFGHALGLFHVWQHPDADCDFLWQNEDGYVETKDNSGKLMPDSAGRRPGIYSLFAESPYFWSQQKISDYMRPNPLLYMPIKPSPDTVMMYVFPPECFRLGDKSPWYIKKPLEHLSEHDKLLIQLMYPAEDNAGTLKSVDKALGKINPKIVASVAAVSTIEKYDLKTSWEILEAKTGPDKALEGANDPGLRGEYRRNFNQSCDFVCLFRAKDGFTHSELGDFRKDQGFGTGFMIGPSLVLTCNHVLPSDDDAASTEIVFFRDNIPASYSLSDKAIVVKSPINALDFSIVRAKPGGDGKTPGARGYYDLQESYIKRKSLYANATLLNIIHFPGGRPEQQYELRGKSLQLLGKPPKDVFVAYDALTDGGSSGAPVFNDLWRVVALHRGKREKDDETDEFLKKFSKGVRIDLIIQSIIDQDKNIAKQLNLIE